MKTARIPQLLQRLVSGLRLGAGQRSPTKHQALQVLIDRRIEIDCVIDVGVLHGTDELISAFPDVKHYLFEPVEECNEQIALSYANLDYELINKAVGGHASDENLYLHLSGKAGDLQTSATVRSDAKGQNVRSVPMISLDAYFKDNHALTRPLLKIDTDGHEMSVLSGAAELLRRCPIAIVEATVDKLPQITDFFGKHGFTIFDVAEPCYYDDALWQVDLIFVRNDIHEANFERIGGDGHNAEKYSIFK